MGFSEKVCEKVRAERKKQGWSQVGFAIEIGMSTYHYGEIERKHVNMSLDTVDRIAAGLKMEPYELLKFDDEK